MQFCYICKDMYYNIMCNTHQWWSDAYMHWMNNILSLY